ncbi:MAG: HIT domain-containing protein [Actinomycetota bacterium]
MPVDKLHETGLVVAFRHPKPTHETHILIVPKRAIASFEELESTDLPVVADVIACAQRIVQDLGLNPLGYSLVVNGGPRQDVAQIHFHLLAGEPLATDF